MARLDRLPEQSIIKGFKKQVDFYTWKGIPVARKWPRKYQPPRTVAMVASQQTFKLVTQSWKDLDPQFILAANGMVAGTSQRNFDLYQSLQYGRQLDYSNGPYFHANLEDTLLAIPITAQPSNTPTTLAVNSVTYIPVASLYFSIPWELVTFSRYYLQINGLANAAAQSIDAQIQELNTGLPLGDGNPDLTVLDTLNLYTGNPRAISTGLAVSTPYRVALKGSNATVDLSIISATLFIWQD